jgi:hypothetical protein
MAKKILSKARANKLQALAPKMNQKAKMSAQGGIIKVRTSCLN